MFGPWRFGRVGEVGGRTELASMGSAEADERPRRGLPRAGALACAEHGDGVCAVEISLDIILVVIDVLGHKCLDEPVDLGLES